MGKNSKLLTIVLVLSILGNIVLGYGLYRESKDHQAVKIAVENNYQRDFLKLNDNVEQIKLQLAQSLVSASDEQLLLGVSNLWRDQQLECFAFKCRGISGNGEFFAGYGRVQLLSASPDNYFVRGYERRAVG